jgi:glycerol kinase
MILYDADNAASGNLTPVFSHQVPLQLTTPNPGWAQMSPNMILDSVLACANGVLKKAGADASQIVGLGITNQRESICVWDRATGEPLYDSVLWLDMRTQETVANLEKDLGQDGLRDMCGLPLSTYFTGVKLRWLMDNVPEVKAKLESGDAMVGTVDSWLIWKLTGGASFVTDVTNASRTMLMNLKTSEWNEHCMGKLLSFTFQMGPTHSLKQMHWV